MEILESMHEGKPTNFFGQYNSPRLKNRYEVIKLYENGFCYFGEAAQILSRNMAYEIPSLMKAKQHNEKRIVDNHRRLLVSFYDFCYFKIND